MARRFTIELLMNLAKSIGANPNKFMGTKTNISFLGKGPTKNPLFQSRLAGLENATMENLGKPETLVSAVEDAMGFASAGKLNSIQTEILGHNLLGIKNIIKPPVLPSASVTDIAPGIEGLRRFPKETHQFMGRPLKGKDFSEIDRMVMEGKIPDARGRTWNLSKARNEKFLKDMGDDLQKSRLQGTGPEAFNAALNQKTGMSRSIARRLLQQDPRLNLKPEEIFSLRSGSKGADPLELMRKYYGRSMTNFDEWMDSILSRRVAGANARELADLALKEIELIPQFAHGGLAEILQAPKMKHGGRIGFFKGAQADTAEGKAMSPGTSADYTPGAGHRTGGDGQGVTTQTNLIPSPITHGEIDQMNFDKYISPSFTAKYSPAKAAMLRARIYNQNLLTEDDINVEGSLSGAAGNLNYDVPFTDEGIQGVNLDYGNFSANIDPNKNINMAFNKNIGGWDTGVNYDSEGNLMATIGTKFNKGGLAGLLEV